MKSQLQLQGRRKIWKYERVSSTQCCGYNCTDNCPPPLVEIGLTDVPKSGGMTAPRPCPPVSTAASHTSMYYPGLSSLGVPGAPCPPPPKKNCVCGGGAEQLTLSQPRGADYAHKMIQAASDFQTFRRPWYRQSSKPTKVPIWYTFIKKCLMKYVGRRSIKLLHILF